VENLVNSTFWKGKSVFVTGHTGFKGSWLCIWLSLLGAKVTGYALSPNTNPNMFELCFLDESVCSIIGDIRDRDSLQNALFQSRPEIIIHMAAQPLVRKSYHIPIETFETNIMGTAYLLEAVKNYHLQHDTVKAILNVTTDKVYENKEWVWGYRENEPLGGFDPYSSSKACSELVTAAYRNSFFHPDHYHTHCIGIASARAGNVIGGGDWSEDRLVPDCLESLVNNQIISIRNPNAIRPWQHVLEPLSGYLILAERLVMDGPTFSQSWNFGPKEDNVKNVQWIVEKLCSYWGQNASYKIEKLDNLHESQYLKLDCSKAKSQLDWCPKWQLDTSLQKVVEWSKAFQSGGNMKNMTIQQINEYMAT
jgi:CDP-glucose 4,6-dehydratase